jgi:hypothetical protein
LVLLSHAADETLMRGILASPLSPLSLDNEGWTTWVRISWIWAFFFSELGRFTPVGCCWDEFGLDVCGYLNGGWCLYVSYLYLYFPKDGRMDGWTDGWHGCGWNTLTARGLEGGARGN